MKNFILLFLLVVSSELVFAAWPQARNTGGLVPSVTTAYLGDRKTLSHDSWSNIDNNWPRWKVYIHTSADIQNGYSSAWSSYANSENKSALTPKFDRTGIWYWGFEVNYTASNVTAWYCRNTTAWENMWGTPTSDLTIDVLPLPSPAELSITASSGQTELNWIPDATYNNVLIVCRENEYATAPSNGTSYTVGASCGGGTVIYSGSAQSFTHSGLDNSKHYYYSVYTNNNDYYSAAAQIDQALPVELTAFTAKAEGKAVKLSWNTATEQNNVGFEVERKSGGVHWQKIAFVEGAGNSNAERSYSFTDNSALNGKYSYRLKQIDADGKFKYSQETEVSVDAMPGGFVVEQNYPNPFNPSTTIRFGFNKPTNAALTVYNQLGEQVAVLFNGQAESQKMYSVDFDGSGFTSGVYFYRLQTPERTEVRRMILVK